MPDTRTLAEDSWTGSLVREAASRAKSQSESVEAERTGILQLRINCAHHTISAVVPHIAPDQVVVPRCGID